MQAHGLRSRSTAHPKQACGTVASGACLTQALVFDSKHLAVHSGDVSRWQVQQQACSVIALCSRVGRMLSLLHLHHSAVHLMLSVSLHQWRTLGSMLKLSCSCWRLALCSRVECRAACSMLLLHSSCVVIHCRAHASISASKASLCTVARPHSSN